MDIDHQKHSPARPGYHFYTYILLTSLKLSSPLALAPTATAVTQAGFPWPQPAEMCHNSSPLSVVLISPFMTLCCWLEVETRVEWRKEQRENKAGGGGRQRGLGGDRGRLIKMSMSNQPDLIAVSNKTRFHRKGYSSLRKGRGWVVDRVWGWGWGGWWWMYRCKAGGREVGEGGIEVSSSNFHVIVIWSWVSVCVPTHVDPFLVILTTPGALDDAGFALLFWHTLLILLFLLTLAQNYDGKEKAEIANMMDDFALLFACVSSLHVSLLQL